eukprot:g1463.t1
MRQVNLAAVPGSKPKPRILSVESWKRSPKEKQRILGSGLSVENIVGSEKKQEVSDVSELKRLDARKGLQENRDGARETQIERFSLDKDSDNSKDSWLPVLSAESGESPDVLLSKTFGASGPYICFYCGGGGLWEPLLPMPTCSRLLS